MWKSGISSCWGCQNHIFLLVFPQYGQTLKGQKVLEDEVQKLRIKWTTWTVLYFYSALTVTNADLPEHCPTKIIVILAIKQSFSDGLYKGKYFTNSPLILAPNKTLHSCTNCMKWIKRYKKGCTLWMWGWGWDCVSHNKNKGRKSSCRSGYGRSCWNVSGQRVLWYQSQASRVMMAARPCWDLKDYSTLPCTKAAAAGQQMVWGLCERSLGTSSNSRSMITLTHLYTEKSC